MIKEIQLKESEIRNNLIGQTITKINAFNFNHDFTTLNPKSKWVIDGGIQLELNDRIFSFGWNFDNEGFEYSFENIGVLFGNQQVFALNDIDHTINRTVSCCKIVDVELEWGFYSLLNEDFEVSNEKMYMPVHLNLKLNNQLFFNLALVLVNYQNETELPIIEQLDLGGELFISINEKSSFLNNINLNK